MASIKEATESAIAFAQETLGPERTRGIRLEEIESTMVRDKESWVITLSMIVPVDDPMLVVGNMASAIFGPAKREYKSFTVLKSTGKVDSMKIRELAVA